MAANKRTTPKERHNSTMCVDLASSLCIVRILAHRMRVSTISLHIHLLFNNCTRTRRPYLYSCSDIVKHFSCATETEKKMVCSLKLARDSVADL